MIGVQKCSRDYYPFVDVCRSLVFAGLRSFVPGLNDRRVTSYWMTPPRHASQASETANGLVWRAAVGDGELRSANRDMQYK